MASVVMPAHDEATLIGDHLHRLLDQMPPGALEVIVVCNGCHDDTAELARAVPGVRVLEIPEASKAAAVAAGNAAASVFPRLHLDADCAMTGRDVLRLAASLADGSGTLAAAPERRLVLARSSWAVRAYYRVWQRLPQVREGIFGRGAMAVSADGQARIDALPKVLSDDLAVSEAFSPAERRVVPDAVVTVRAPRSTRDLLRRRIRVVTGTKQADRLGTRGPAAVTSPRTLLRMLHGEPRLAPSMSVFVAVTLLARWSAQRRVQAGDYSTWLRDESSRRV
ncbi:glycosyltransferase [Nocardioides insulae]|uniref:glycosyltransferase n=1 Tax=Nocardioides insulae TaxID=394734 RepID=UPI000422F471|nr:glycosyltransferase [Nocardioides insulae]